MTDQRRPIGWWLKEADARLDEAFDRRLRDRGVTRRDWQVLASLARRPTAGTDLIAELAPFAGPDAVEHVVAGIAARGWVDTTGESLRLTAAGVDEHAALAPLVDAVRQQVAAALPQEDYVTLVQLLETLVAGLSQESG